ncbi:hypothetical protein OQA88_12539 [Cercophora sp. LCS_1]
MSLAALRNWFTQWYPPNPTFTEECLPSQFDRVFLVTGGSKGIGFELCKMLYTTGATIYMASRSQEEADQAIKDITSSACDIRTPGVLKFLCLDLMDLATIKTAAEEFAKQETCLDVLWLQAGIGARSVPPLTKTKQGLDAFIGAHCVAHLFLAELLLPQLREAAKIQIPGTVRLVWTASSLAELATSNGGIEMDRLDGIGIPIRDYAASKAGNWILGIEFGRRHGGDTKAPILSVTQNPGNLKTGIWENVQRPIRAFMDAFVLYEPKFGGYTELYAGLSPDLTMENQGAYIMPWGRIQEHTSRQDILQAAKPVEEGGGGLGAKFWEWCEEQWKEMA